MAAAALTRTVLPDEKEIEGLTLPGIGDRHVLAAAIKCNASVIVTVNLKAFPATHSSLLILRLCTLTISSPTFGTLIKQHVSKRRGSTSTSGYSRRCLKP